MNVSDLSARELSYRLRETSLRFRTGPFAFSLRTDLHGMSDAIGVLYGDFPLTDSQYADFHVAVCRLHGLRHVFSPRAAFLEGGASQFDFPLSSALPFLEWGLNRCVFRSANNYLMVHAATVERNGRALFLVGASGSGKSTLCAALVLSGWRLLSDEIALISPNDGKVAGLARPVGLKDESIGLIQNFAPGVFIGPASRTAAKGIVAHMRPPQSSVLRAQEKASPALVCFVKYERGAPLRWQTVSKAQAMIRIAKCGLNYGLLGQKGFETIARVVDSCDSVELTYSRLQEGVALLNGPDFAGKLLAGGTSREQAHVIDTAFGRLAPPGENGDFAAAGVGIAGERRSHHPPSVQTQRASRKSFSGPDPRKSPSSS